MIGEMDDMKIGLIGIGAIGGFLAKNLKDELVWICDIDENVCKARMKELGIPSRVEYVRKPEAAACLRRTPDAAWRIQSRQGSGENSCRR